jgi:hypothetical protein
MRHDGGTDVEMPTRIGLRVQHRSDIACMLAVGREMRHGLGPDV